MLVMRAPEVEEEEKVMDYRREKEVQRWSCAVALRQSEVVMEVAQVPPVLVGEWFPIRLTLTSPAAAAVTSLQVVAVLRDAADPLVADTTLLALNPQRPPSVTSPTEAAAGRVELVVGALAAGATTTATLYMKASTVGPRAVVLQLTCATGSLPSQLTRHLELVVEDPFTLSCTFLTKQLEETVQANTDELFLLSASLSSSSPHPLRVLETRLEARPPLAANTRPTNSLAGMLLTGAATVEQLFPLTVASSGLLTQLDTQTLHTGKFVMSWQRVGTEVVNTTQFDLPTVKLVRSLLYAECKLPASGVLRTPLQAVFTLYNRSSEMQEFSLTTEPSEAFMFSGPKQVRIKLFPLASYTLGHMFYPLVCGAAPLPRLRIQPVEGGGSGAQEALERLLPTHLTVLPRHRAEREPTLATKELITTKAVVLPNLPFKKATSRA